MFLPLNTFLVLVFEYLEQILRCHDRPKPIQHEAITFFNHFKLPRIAYWMCGFNSTATKNRYASIKVIKCF